MSIINVRGLTKKYADFYAVDHISFSVERGTMLGFLGVNGAGKSTTIHMLSTLLRPDAGSAELCGCMVGAQDSHIRRKIGIVYQQNCLDDLLSVKENLLHRGILHGATKKEAAIQLMRLSEILKLEDIFKKRYRTLSGGQKRRCEIAAALMHTPEILFLDEPTTGLDPATRQDVWHAITNLQRNEKITVFLTTHYMEEATRSDNIIILDHGKIIDSGSAYDLKEKYASDKLRLYYSFQSERIIMEKLEPLAKQSRIIRKKTGCLLLHEMYTYYLWKRPVSRYYDKRYSGYYFSGVPEDVADTYREIVGIDLYISGKQVSAATSLAILLIFGLIFLMIGVVVLRHEKRSDR